MKNELNKEKPIKKPWPTKDAMEQIYKKNLWGGDESDFYSGQGSHNPEIVNPYTKVLRSFLTSFKSPISVCDLGCGDFNVGKELVKHTKNYVAADIVSELIQRNKEKFKAENLEFQCLDLAKDKLPAVDCVLIRQVLQHLSNTEVEKIVRKLPAYKYVIITEHIPEGEFTANADIISGQGTRLKKQSGINLLAPPFNLKTKETEELLRVTSNNFKGVILTTLYTLF
ncbi:class I SAM-dependent methyltransferase [Aequorivita marina]|uniref:class I SAM-dependent methyltransferase n=1 Tax=Aequorivita marina TaxID=3073654 RepID=UPI002875D51C|nr:class I SAM-dependent methyltransferase [Aequorivita sp. S2608]MDS1299616.1 class I SAM-dependent methyltransferase [Aequorivita sp. S2608]